MVIRPFLNEKSNNTFEIEMFIAPNAVETCSHRQEPPNNRGVETSVLRVSPVTWRNPAKQPLRRIFCDHRLNIG